MVRSIVIVLFLSAFGDAVAGWSQLPVPGPAIGLVALAGLFALRGAPDRGAAKLFDTISPYFPLFFIPAAAGIVVSADLLAEAWVHVLVAVAFGTTVTIVVTGLVAQGLLRLTTETKTA